MTYKHINPVDVVADKNQEHCILDVRTTAEVETEALPDAIHIPLHELDADSFNSALAKRSQSITKVYLLCQAGRRAEMAADQLYGKVSPELYIIEGGMNAIKQAQIPLQTGTRKVISLERQVRIAAGFLVFSGVLLGTLVDSNFYFLSGFVGAGLMFAGITDTCMMGMLIARMPWNK